MEVMAHMKKRIAIFLAALMVGCLTACGNTNEISIPISPYSQSMVSEDSDTEPEVQEEMTTVPSVSIPVLDEIQEISAEYLQESDQPGTIERLDYQTESYTNTGEIQDKYAYVYVPLQL